MHFTVTLIRMISREILAARVECRPPATFESVEGSLVTGRGETSPTRPVSQPTWTPDSIADECMLCGKKFSVFFR